MVDDSVSFNGVDGATGRLLDDSLGVEELARSILGSTNPRTPRGVAADAGPHFGEVLNVDLEDLGDAGWALVASAGTPHEVLDALAPLRDLRRREAGDLYQEFTADDGIRPTDTKRAFLARRGVGAAAAPRPEQVPYYLLLVGDPAQIGFDLQYQLDVQYAVGRIAFETPAEYRAYAERVCAAADDAPTQSVHLFGPRHRGDRATALSASKLIEPLAADLARSGDWQVGVDSPDGSTKEALTSALAGEGGTLLFTASHGLGFPQGDREQRSRQGSLVCQDWPGPLLRPGRVDPAYCFGGNDAAALESVATRVMMSFACFGAGTPARDEYDVMSGMPARCITDVPFIASLPTSLLAHPRSNLVGFLGHIERAWGSSFISEGVGGEHHVFRDVLLALMQGWRLGHAAQFLNDRYQAFASEFHEVSKGIREQGDRVDPPELVRLWTETNDARAYAVLGDPAIRLPRPP